LPFAAASAPHGISRQNPICASRVAARSRARPYDACVADTSDATASWTSLQGRVRTRRHTAAQALGLSSSPERHAYRFAPSRLLMVRVRSRPSWLPIGPPSTLPRAGLGMASAAPQ
jgi:hypothetical protein